MKEVYIIAEIGVNHNGDLSIAQNLIDHAVAAGADAVKFQSFKADSLVTTNAAKAGYQTKNLGNDKITQYEMLKKLELSWNDLTHLKEYCDKKSIDFLCTPFDLESVDYLTNLVNSFKIASGDLTNQPLLERVAKQGKPIILSTGMSTLAEIEKAIQQIQAISSAPLSLLHCTTSYPCSMEEVNLKAISTMEQKFKLPIGYSDHTLGIHISLAAVALGAKIIEKHITLDQNLSGPDHKASILPAELSQLVRFIREIEIAFGDGEKKPQPSELKNKEIARRSVVFTESLKKGNLIQKHHLAIKRPGTGLDPSQLEYISGKILLEDVVKDQLVEMKHIEGNS